MCPPSSDFFTPQHLSTIKYQSWQVLIPTTSTPEYLSALPLTYLKFSLKCRILNKALSLPQTHCSHIFIARELEDALVKSVISSLSDCLPACLSPPFSFDRVSCILG